MKKTIFFPLFALFIFSQGCGEAEKIEISDAWIREVPNGIDITALYISVKNNQKVNERLLSVKTSLSESAEIHKTVLDKNGTSKMVKLEAVVIPAGEKIDFTPGGLHIMLIGLTKNISDNDFFDIYLNFKEAGVKKIRAAVKSQ